MQVTCCDVCTQITQHQNLPLYFSTSIQGVVDITVKINIKKGKDICLNCLQEAINNKIELLKRG